VENSFLLRLWRAVVRHLLSLDMVSWGGGMLAFGITLLAVTTFRFLGGQLLTFAGIQLAFSVAAIISGLLSASCREPLGEMLLDSGILSRLLIDFAGIRRSALKVEKAEHGLIIPVTIGILLALVTLRIRILYMVAAVIALLGAALVLCIPETGLLFILLGLPFLPTMLLAAACLYVNAAFLFKWMRGKRMLRFETVDLLVVAFGLVLLLLGGLTSLRPMDSLKQVAVQGVFLLTYFTAANGIRSYRMSKKAINCLLLSLFLASMLGIYQNFAGLENAINWIDEEMFAEIGARIVGPFDNPNVFGEYLILLLPLALSTLLCQRGLRRLAGGVITAAAGLALVYTWSRGAWLGAIASLGLLLLSYPWLTRLALPGLLMLPFLPAFLPQSILSRLMSIGNLADTSTAYRVSIWTASCRMLGDIWPAGIGTGSPAFTALYPAYALGGAAFALHSHNLFLQIFVETGILGFSVFLLLLIVFFRHVFSCYRHLPEKEQGTAILSLGLGVLALMVQGLTDHVWYN
ncbi:MAG: O-antigen ligase family protein, partial [Clostridia bacterium]|nr:O-antigen ligase family protein [Clostridia bacterium]